ncbi:hypothetical protein CKALI_08960 [Corynebacterium kalinowskii]|uniref:DUF3558 domain-containing protein n=1 Tax=Corynebacterium kalinowskii TaxID=2675216 RepID=A0A6B8VSN1_9CORY|nr:DUF3558 family protein [Corynebacterium kalinowskii]QGU02647.1 hypothetical protein CKALI_08960 [Corynebacterium kalinowskii]
MRQRLGSLRTLSTAIAITYFSLSLTSCTPPDADTAPSKGETPATGSADTAPIDVHSPATFDPKDPNFKLFDPCTELDDEVFQKAGLGKRSRIGDESDGSFHTCTFATDESSAYFGTVSISTNSVDFETVAKKTHIVKTEASQKIPQVYQYRLSEQSKNECASVAQTSRGQLDVLVMSFDKAMSPELICGESLAFLETLYAEVEMKSRNGTRRN